MPKPIEPNTLHAAASPALNAEEITTLFGRYAAGDQSAAAALMPKIYDELRKVASNHFRHERADHTLQATALVNEAFIRLNEHDNVPWHDRVHFFRLASQVMRNILVDHARMKNADKRGGDVHITSLDHTALNYHDQCVQHLYLDDVNQTIENRAQIEINFIALDAALAKLRALSPRQAEVVDLRFFGGLSIEETAKVMNISPATIKREWTMARLFVKLEMEAQVGAGLG
ncbi:MAG: sigma-70 family RNA polymerase sigma factor [Casimicrobium sp.]